MLTGFLGSGKTTILNAILADPRYARTAVVVNEWGAIAVDHHLVREASGAVALLGGGCICCRVAGDVVRTLRELHFQRAQARVPPFERVIIETTGLADPAPLLATLAEIPLASARYALSGVVATVDAEHGWSHLDAHPEALKQAAMADRLVVTKVDRAAAQAVGRLEARLASLNPGAMRLRSPPADPSGLLDTGIHRDAGAAPNAEGWLDAGAFRHFGRPRVAHDARIASFAWRLAEPRAWEDVESALETLVERSGERIWRMKGLVNAAGEPGPRAVHAVQHTLYPSARLDRWPDADRSTRLVFIGRDLDPAEVADILGTLHKAT